MTKKFSKNIIIYGATNIFKSLVPLLILPVLTAYLSLNDFGVLSLVETTILFITPFVMLNINGAINVEYFKVKHSILSEFITNALILSLCSFLLLLSLFYIFQSEIASLLHIDNVLVLWMVVFALLRVISGVVSGLYQSRQEPIKFMKYAISQTLVDFALSYIFIVYLFQGYTGRFIGAYGALFIFSILGIYILYKMEYLTRPAFKYTKEILNFGIPLIPHAIGGTIMAMSDRYFISYFIGNEEVGLYTIAYQISALMILVSISVNQAWSPMLFGLLKKKDMKQVYKYSLLLLALYIFTAILIYLLQDFLFYLFVDEKFYAAKEFFGWLLLGFLLQSFYFLVTNFLFFEKRTKLLANITITGAILNIVLNYFMIEKYGVVGVAYATAISWFIYFILVLFVVIKIYTKRTT